MTTATELVISLPFPPNMANGRMHWRVKERHRAQYLVLCRGLWYAEIDGCSARSSMHEFARQHRTKSLLSFCLRLGGRMDDDNALARCKWPVDWLVSEGILVDDSPKWCSMSIPEQVITRDKAQQRLEITIRYAEA